MKKVGAALFLVVVAALAYALLHPTGAYLLRQRLYGKGVAWAARTCASDADCVAVAYQDDRATCAPRFWVTAKKNPELNKLQQLAAEMKRLEASLRESEGLGISRECKTEGPPLVHCSQAVCVASGR